MLYNLVDCKKYDFAGVAASQKLAVSLGYVDTSSARFAAAGVRLHSATIPTGAKIRVNVYRAWPFPAQPTVLFYDATVPAFAVVEFTHTDDVTTGLYRGTKIDDVAAPMLLFMIEGEQPGGAGQLNCVASVAGIVYPN